MSKHHVHTRQVQRLKDEFFDQCRRADAVCWLCDTAIDYSVAPGSTDSSFNTDHYFPASTHPQHYADPTNFRPSHALCNTRRGNAAPRAGAGLGEPVAAWW